MRVPEATKQGYVDIPMGGCVDLAQINSKTRRGRKMEDKSNCLTTDMQMYQVVGCAERGRYLYEGHTEQHLEINKDNKANAITTVTKDSMVCEPIQIGSLGKNSQGNRVYSVRGKSVTIKSCAGGKGAKTGLYAIDLPDGDYLIRKLTPIEAERLQTLPDNYTECVSNTQRYKCIGNGWTVDVIAHIFKGLAEQLKSQN